MMGRLRTTGIRLRITLGAGSVFALALVIAAVFLIAGQRTALTRDIETAGRLRVEDLVASLEGGSLPSSIAIPFEERSFVQIVGPAGKVLRSSPNIEGEGPVTPFSSGTGPRARTVRGLPIGDGPFRVVAMSARLDGGTVTVYVGSSLEPVTDAVRNLLATLALGGPALLAIVIGLTWVAVGRALGPVEQIRREVASISERELHRRVPLPTKQDEIGRLALTMNTMLERLDDAAGRQRRFLADASHELRSPLSTMRSQLEVDLAHPDHAAWQTTAQALLEETLRMQRLVDDLLELARLDDAPATTHNELIDLDEIVLAEARRTSTRGKVIVDALKVSAIQITGDADSLRRAVRNLLDNAERHATRSVSVAVEGDDTHARIVVRDDGPGVAAEERERIFERFARSDAARARDAGGTGLGLAITHDIATSHGGTLSIQDSTNGATFVLKLPRATPTHT